MNSKLIKFLLSVCVLCLPLSLLAQHGSTSDKSVGIRFMDVPIAKALETASVLNKPVFIDCYTVWCGPCKYLSSDVFPDKRVGDFYNEKFICLQIDMEKGEGLEIAKKYEIKSYPTLLFLDANGEVMHRDMGSRSVDNFIKLGETALNPEKNSASIIKKIKNGEVTAATVTYTLDNASRNIKLTIEWLDKLFGDKPEATWSNDELWPVLEKYAPLKSKYGEYIINNKELLNKIGKTRVEFCVERMVANFYNMEFRELGYTRIGVEQYLENYNSPMVDRAFLRQKFSLGLSLVLQHPGDQAAWTMWFDKAAAYYKKYEPQKAPDFQNIEVIIQNNKPDINYIIATIQSTKHEYAPLAIQAINFTVTSSLLSKDKVLSQSAIDSINSGSEAILKNCTLDPLKVNNFAWALVSHPQRDKFLQTARKLSAYTLTKGDSYYWLDTYATICAQLHQFDEAIKYQAKAIESVKKQDPQKIKFYEDMLDKFKKHETVF